MADLIPFVAVAIIGGATGAVAVVGLFWALEYWISKW
jgi:uncharacterized protein (DUF697 family)